MNVTSSLATLKPAALLAAMALLTSQPALAAFPESEGAAGVSMREWAARHALENGAAACLACRSMESRLTSARLDAADTSPDRSLFFDPATGKNLLNYPPHPVVDYANMRLDIRIADMNNPALDATQVLTFSPIAEDLAELILDAKGLAISSVSTPNSRASFRIEGLKLILSFDPPLPASTPADVTIAYSVAQPPEGLFWYPESPAWPGRPAQIHTQGEPEYNSFWFPCHDFPNDKLDTQLNVSVPRGYTVSSNGRFLGKVNSILTVTDALGRSSLQGCETWRFAQDQAAGGPHENYLVSLIVGKFDIVDVAGQNVPAASSTGLPRPRNYSSPLQPLLGKSYSKPGFNVPMPVYVPPGRGPDVLRTYGRTYEMTRFFSALFDHPYPWAKYAQLVVHNFAFGGMENTSATTMFDTAYLSESSLLDHDLDGLVSHELGHQWFGDLITCNSWEHIWLNEGFATYLSTLWFEHRDGPEAYQVGVLGSFDSVIGADRGKAPETPAMVSKAYRKPVEALGRSANPYSKGASILHMLRRRLGDQIFFTGVRVYLDRFHNRTAETDDLRKAFEEVSGESLEQFFTQWCNRPGVPRLTVTAAAEGSRLTLTLNQNQPIDGYNPAFAIELPVTVRTAGGKTVTSPWTIDSKTQTLILDLPDAPVMVAIDPDQYTLAELTIKQPSQWLLEQLSSGPTLASRIQAVRALASSAEQGAADALTALASSPKENRQLRIECIRALEALNRPSEILAVSSADKSDAYVRIQALDSMASVAAKAGAGVQARDQIIARLSSALSDPSVRARASAIRGLASLKSESNQSTILALGSRDRSCDSQHDTIRQAVTDALISYDAAACLPVAIDLSRPGVNSRTRAGAISAAARLSRHDSSAITALLATFLTDPEIRVRRAAINGLGEIATPEAISMLKARVGAVTSPYERLDIEKTIKDAEAKEVSASRS